MVTEDDAACLELPDSVRQYLRQPEIGAGVDALLVRRRRPTPESLAWSDLPNYYRAQAAAQRVQLDYVLYLEQLWRIVWADLLAGWAPRSIDEQFDSEGFSLSADHCFTERWFGRMFHRGKVELSAELMLDGSGLHLGYSLWSGTKILAKALEGFHFDRELNTLWQSAALPAEPGSLPGLRALAGRAAEDANRFAEGHEPAGKPKRD